MKRRLKTLAPIALLLVGGAYALASWNWCGRWELGPPSLVSAGLARGALLAGAARVSISPPYPVVVAGYNPPRPEVDRAAQDLEARAVVLEVAPVKVAFVSVDLLLVPDDIGHAVREKAQSLGFSTVIVTATHAHSAMGAFDSRLVSQLAGTGRYREGARGAVIAAALSALARADDERGPATWSFGTGKLDGLVRARSGARVDETARRLKLSRGEVPLAELWIVASHPTLEPRGVKALSADYPGLVDPNDGPVIVVLQGAVGNASAQVPEGEGGAASRYANALAERMEQVPLADGGDAFLGFAVVRTALPRPDASRLAPWFARAAGDNLLCSSAPKEAELETIRIGDLVLVGMPFEPTFAAAQVLREESAVDQVLALAGGYGGYVEPAAVVRAREGESKRQYFGPDLLDVLKDAAKVAVSAVRPAR